MAATIENIIKDCVQSGLKLPRDPIQQDVFDRALASVNDWGQQIWDAWPWDNTKLDEFDMPTPDAEGIVTFASNVDSIRAIRPVQNTNVGVVLRVYNQDDLNAASEGVSVATERFKTLADDASGNRRIQVGDTSVSYKVLATYRFTPFTESNYETATYPIDRAEQALKKFVCDDLRIWAGEQPVGDGSNALQSALVKETDVQDRDFQVVPRSPMFDEVGNWW